VEVLQVSVGEEGSILELVGLNLLLATQILVVEWMIEQMVDLIIL